MMQKLLLCLMHSLFSPLTPWSNQHSNPGWRSPPRKPAHFQGSLLWGMACPPHHIPLSLLLLSAHSPVLLFTSPSSIVSCGCVCMYVSVCLCAEHSLSCVGPSYPKIYFGEGQDFYSHLFIFKNVICINYWIHNEHMCWLKVITKWTHHITHPLAQTLGRLWDLWCLLWTLFPPTVFSASGDHSPAMCVIPSVSDSISPHKSVATLSLSSVWLDLEVNGKIRFLQRLAFVHSCYFWEIYPCSCMQLRLPHLHHYTIFLYVPEFHVILLAGPWVGPIFCCWKYCCSDHLCAPFLGHWFLQSRLPNHDNHRKRHYLYGPLGNK